MPINYKRCLKCHENRGVRILYGYPAPEAVELEAIGKLVIGGCMIEIGAPEYECLNCHYQWTSAEAIEAAYNDIIAIKLSIGGFHQGFYEIYIDFEQGQVTYEHRLSMEAPVVKRIEDVAAEKYFLTLYNLLKWKKSYSNDEMLDGEQWEMAIIRSGRTLYKSGSNAYPKEWQEFCHWLERLIGWELFS